MHGKKQGSEKFLSQSLYPLVSQGFIEIELSPNAGSSVAWKNAGVLFQMRLGYGLWGWLILTAYPPLFGKTWRRGGGRGDSYGLKADNKFRLLWSVYNGVVT